MDQNTTPQNRISQNGDVLRIENAVIEEAFTDTHNTGFILISYGVEGQNNMTNKSMIRLNVGNNTMITNQFGEALCLCDLKEGMLVDADFSAAMTRSIPPQSNAFKILAYTEVPSTVIVTDRVVNVDQENGFLLTGNPYDIYDQMIFTVSNDTVIVDQTGMPLSLMAIQPGQLVRVEHAIFQTMSIPPQSPAFRIQVI